MSGGAIQFQEVLAALAADSSTEFGVPGAQVQMLRKIEGPYSCVQRVRVQIPARTVHAFIKVVKPRGPGPEALDQADRFLQREYRATAALYNRMKQDAGIGAVRPIALLQEHRTLVTEEVPGRPFSELLAEASSLSDDLLQVASRIGGWVRIYQALGEAPDTREVADVRSYLDHRLELLRSRALSNPERQAVLTRFDALSRQIGVRTLPALPSHGDLSPGNIIVDDSGRVTVLDFTMAKTGPVHLDLSHVFFHLELMAARHPARAGMLSALQHALLAGYDPSLSADDPLFRMMLLQHAVCHVAQLSERRLPVLDAAYRWFLRRRWQLCARMLEAPRLSGAHATG